MTLVLGGALIGALAGFAGAWLQRLTAREQLIHEEVEPWRKVLVETTGAFVDSWHEFSMVPTRAIDGGIRSSRVR